MTTNEQIEAIARECADTISRAAYNKGRGRFHGELTALQEMQIVLTAANRIAALKVKESGAVEALGGCFLQLHDQQAMRDDSCDHIYQSALTALRAIISEGTP